MDHQLFGEPVGVDKSWLVIGPGRTGSLTIVRSIYSLYNYNFNKITYVGPNDSIRPINPLDVVHAHDLNWLEQVNEHTEVVISTRSPVESALSWCILPAIGSYHFYPFREESMKSLQSLEVKKFYLNPNDFLNHYNRIVDFYTRLKVKNNFTILDYSEWESDPTKILQKLNYKVDAPAKYLTVKNPGLHCDWIENWEEISEIFKNLPNNVNDLLGYRVIYIET